MNGMTALEASEALGLPVGAIKAQLSRARAKLAKSLSQELGPRVPETPLVDGIRIAQ